MLFGTSYKKQNLNQFCIRLRMRSTSSISSHRLHLSGSAGPAYRQPIDPPVMVKLMFACIYNSLLLFLGQVFCYANAVLHGRRILGAQRSPWRIRTLVFGLKQLIASAENAPYKAVDTQCHQRELRMIAVQAPPITIVFALRPLCD